MSSKIEVDGRITWVSYVSNIVSHTYGYKPIGLDMANGNMGVAVFLATLSSYLEDRSLLMLVGKMVRPINDILGKEWSKREFMLRFGTGGTTGVGSIIYGFTKLYELTQNNSYLKAALNFSKIVQELDIRRSIRQDAVSGNAGLLLSLIKLYEISKNGSLKILMKKCYEQIITTGFRGSKFVGWDYQQDKRLLGFSHGSSGILYSLSKYLPYCEDRGIAEKQIQEISGYEERFFDATSNNWPDYRFEEPDLGIVSWCHGAVGIGMSRLSLLNNHKFEKAARRDINRSIEKIISTSQHFLDTACCGNAGRIDFTLELEKLGLSANRQRDYLNWLISIMLERYRNDGDFKYFSKFKTDDVNVGFYQGLSGIGYQLLRFLDPYKFSSVLLFE